MREKQAREAPAFAALSACAPRWRNLIAALSDRALAALAVGDPVDPNNPSTWVDERAHAEAVLRRHTVSELSARRLTDQAREQLIAGQRDADLQAGIDWSAPATHGELSDKLTVAHRQLPIDLAEPEIWQYVHDRREALAQQHDLSAGERWDLSPMVLKTPRRFASQALCSWRIASPTWRQIARVQLAVPDTVPRPVGLMLAPASGGDDWTLQPTLSLQMILLIDSLGGEIDRSLSEFEMPFSAGERQSRFLERINQAVLTARVRERHESASRHTEAAAEALGSTLTPGAASPLDEWGRLEVLGRGAGRRRYRVVTQGSRTLPRRLVGGRPVERQSNKATSIVSRSMDIGEAVGVAQDTGLPLLLTSEAAAELDGLVRVGRSKSRPGIISITTAAGIEASTERFPVERAVGALRALKRQDERPVVVSARARQVIRMATVPPLRDDPILLPPQQLPAAVIAVGSCLNASDVGTGKTVMIGRAIAYRASTTPALRVILLARPRLLTQWHDELAFGDATRGPLTPDVKLVRISEHTSVAAQVRGFHRECGQRPGMLLVPDGVLERHANALKVIRYHLLVVEEGHDYTNTQLERFSSLLELRDNAVDCVVVTATPSGKESADYDRLIGVALGDREMISEHVATREAGNLLSETNAHRMRIGYGPTLIHVPASAMEQWMPTLKPAKAIPIEPDPALAHLLETIREGGRESYRNLIELLQEVRVLEKGGDLYAAAMLEVARVRGRVLSNVGVFLDASVDPETLYHSQATLAQALVQDGLVEPAVNAGGRGEPTMRAIVADTLATISRNDQILVFAQRLRCLHQLARSLDARGVGCQVMDGRLSEEEFDAMKEAFWRGEFPVLCVGEVGQESHNLQCAKHGVHLDLPYIPRPLLQRVGRYRRIGSPHKEVETHIPRVRGGAMEHAIGILASRAGTHHQVLDGFAGVKVEDSAIAGQLAELTDQVAKSKRDEGYEVTAAKLRFAASVFGC